MRRKTTYHTRHLASRVIHKSERIVDVIKIDLALGLNLVEEVEKTKCKDSAWMIPSCWKPADMKELATVGGVFCCLGIIASTVLDPNCMNTRGVEKGKHYGNGWMMAGVFNVVAALMKHT